MCDIVHSAELIELIESACFWLNLAKPVNVSAQIKKQFILCIKKMKLDHYEACYFALTFSIITWKRKNESCISFLILTRNRTDTQNSKQPCIENDIELHPSIECVLPEWSEYVQAVWIHLNAFKIKVQWKFVHTIKSGFVSSPAYWDIQKTLGMYIL